MSNIAIRVKQALLSVFIERQLYIRARGRVSYVPLSSRSQIALSAFFLAFAAWFSFATVNVIFKDEIAERKDREFLEMQLAYENELRRLQLAYDDLNSQIVLTRDWFSETTTSLEKKHHELTRVLEKNASISNELRQMQIAFSGVAKRNSKKGNVDIIGRDEDTANVTLESRTESGDAPAPKVALANEIDSSVGQRDDEALAMPYLPENISRRIATLDTRQRDLLDALEESLDHKIDEFETVINQTDVLTTEEFMARVLPENELSVGGPYIPLQGQPGLNSSLHQQLYRINTNLDRLSGLSKSLAKIPLALPIHDYSITSDFGVRLDPFKKRAAFHSGVDFGATTGTPVHSTLGGTITQAGYKGPYGLVIEIDHGNGFKTRYGHLARSRVRTGQRVEFQQHIGDAGNSGRSTGPHLHYEIWFDGKVRNPAAFLDAGKQIFNIAETYSATPKQ
ncbi:MAG: M23 family metallopeptidase [Pseudomonadota bacterium]|nr:M23 family metallopeptidase [Pseudomonadota bacterium]